MIADVTYCVSPDCKVKCWRHLSHFKDKIPPGTIISQSDFSGVCPTYLRAALEVAEEMEKKNGT